MLSNPLTCPGLTPPVHHVHRNYYKLNGNLVLGLKLVSRKLSSLTSLTIPSRLKIQHRPLCLVNTFFCRWRFGFLDTAQFVKNLIYNTYAYRLSRHPYKHAYSPHVTILITQSAKYVGVLSNRERQMPNSAKYWD